METSIELSSSTRDRILSVARVLFAESGFRGVTIRNIAERARVNVAAVNYHFAGKQQLFSEIVEQCRQDLADNMRNLSLVRQSPADLAVGIFDLLISRGPELLTSFKIVISSHENDLAHSEPKGCDGPPGADFLRKSFERALGRRLSEPDAKWAVRSLFSCIVHQAILYCCGAFKGAGGLSNPTLKELELGIQRLTGAIIHDLKISRSRKSLRS